MSNKLTEIKSKNNAQIKQLRYLQKKKKREEFSSFKIENLRTIYDALKQGFKFKSLFVTNDLLKKDDKRIKYIISKVEKYYIIDPKINKSFSSLTTPSGICAVYDMFADDIDFDSNIIYLNAINDPGNLGTIIRTAVAFGIKNIVLDEKCADIYNQKTINASKDAIFKINITHDEKCKALDDIKKEMKIYATEANSGEDISILKSNETSIQDQNTSVRCVVFGGEANGINNEVRKKVDKFVNIKIDKNTESLNVAIVAGIVFYVMK